MLDDPAMTATGSSDPRESSYGREYWLRRCEGFLVETARRRIGRVTGIRYGRNEAEPDALAIRVGLFRRRLLLVRAKDVVEVLPKQRRIVVNDSARLLRELAS
jgi:hypothetical protein